MLTEHRSKTLFLYDTMQIYSKKREPKYSFNNKVKIYE